MGRWARKPVNHTSWVAVVTPTDRPKSVRNRCLIELFCGVVCVVTLPFWHFCWCRGFCHRTESDLFLFLLLTMLIVYWFLWPLRLVWQLVCCLYKEVYSHIFKCVSFWLHGCCGEWEGGPVNQVNHTSWVAVVTPTDRPKSVRNCCLIELFCGVVCVVTLPFWHFCWCRGFCHRTGSDLLLFVLNNNMDHMRISGT